MMNILIQFINCYLGAILPSIGLGFLFFFIIRAIFNTDKLEREAEEKYTNI